MACKVSLQSSLATLIAISVANSGNGSVQVAGRCIAYVRPATRIPSTLLHLVPMPAWEQRKLGELSSEFQSGDFISAEEILGSGPYPVYGGNGLRGYAKQYNHDGFYALIGRQGALCGNVNTAVGKAYFTEHAVAVKANFLHDTRFLAHLLGCMDLGRYSGQSAQPGLAVGVLKEVETTVPSKAEQQAIGSFFSRLDSLITLHQRKYDKLVIFKKSMLEKMFPKDGESVPEIRFAGFTDPWEQRKFSEIVDVCSGRDYKHLDEGPIPVYGTGGYMTSVSEALSHNRDAIGIGRKGTIDKPYLLKAPFWTVDTLFYAIPKSDINLEFALCSFLNVDWKSKDESTGLPSLSKESINETVLSVPNVVEQNHLGNFFADLDRLITLHQRKLELLQNIKKSLLDKMFA